MDAVVDSVARRNAAIDFHNQSMTTVAGDKHLAYRLLSSSVTVDPTMGQGWYALSNATADLEMEWASIACSRRALALADGDRAAAGDMNPELRAKAWINLAHRLLNVGEIEEAREASARAIEFLEAHPGIDPEGAAFAWTNMAQVLSVEGRTEEALRYAREGYRQEPGSPIVELGLAFALLFGGEYAEGLRHFESRFPYRLPQYLEYPYRRWNGVADHGMTLLVVAEQGAGDTLSFARFLGRTAARVGRVVCQVQPELYGLLGASLRHWGVEVVPLSTQFPVADAWCPFMSLPVALGMTTAEIAGQEQGWTPRVEKRGVPDWKAPGMALHVGIAWGGNPQNGIDKWRSIEMRRFLELYRVPGVQLYSLQVGERVQDLHMTGAAGLVRDLSPYIRDASDTCALIRELDLVVTIESFVGHLCGALGKECWVLASRRGGDWRIGRTGDRALWYPRTRLFRQGVDGEWGPVFRDVVAALGERVAASRGTDAAS